MSTLRFSKDHEWVSPSGDGTAVIGITDYAQEQLGELVYIELPEVGDSFEAGDAVAVAESVKSASDVIIPVSGEVLEVNGDLDDAPEKVNEAPFSDGWFIKIRMSDTSQLDELMDEDSYKKFIS